VKGHDRFQFAESLGMKKLLLSAVMFAMVSSPGTFSQMNPWKRILSAQQLVAMDIAPSGEIYAVSFSDTVWRSDDNAENWVALSFPVSEITAVHATSLGTVYVGTWGHGVYRSMNNGNSWTQSGSSTLKLNRISSNSNGDVFITTFGDSALYGSTDNGTTWTPKISGMQFDGYPLWVDAIFIDSVGHVYVSGIYRSTDNGEHWDWIGITPGKKYLAHTLLTTSAGHIFAGGQDGAFRTTDNGLSWSAADFGTPYGSVRSLVVNSRGYLFRGMFGGVYFSDDGGGNWYYYSSGLTNLEVFDLAVDSRGVLYAATSGGLFRTSSSTVSVNYDELTLPRTVSLSQNYPNPFNPTTTIRFEIPNLEFVTLKVFDVLGREVATLADEVLTPGSYERVFDGNGLPSGIYFYRLGSSEVAQMKKMLLVK